MKGIINKLYRKLFVTAIWEIAYRKCEPCLPFRYDIPFISLPNTKKHWFADPLLFEYDKKPYIFCEAFNIENNIGQIAVSEYRNDHWTTPRIIISNNYHMSYPFVFQDRGNIYMIPETGEGNILEIYECIDFPYNWKKKGNIIENIKLSDPTLFQFNDKWYIYAYVEGKGKYNGYLYEFDCECVKASLVAQKKYKTNIGRSAGMPCKTIQGTYLRPVQDSSTMYGHGIIWNKFNYSVGGITEEFVDKLDLEKIIVDNRLGVYRSHTYSCSTQFEVIDFCRQRFDFLKRYKIFKRKLAVLLRKKLNYDNWLYFWCL